MILFLLFVIIALVLALCGVLLKGLFYLLIIGIVVFVLDLAVVVGRRLRRRPTRRSLR
jgi:UDP-N-acetylmuramyl pentapeptide phosphotransferase/UDP-N-acetylglucosamine-1-phosphate transferase